MPSPSLLEKEVLLSLQTKRTIDVSLLNRSTIVLQYKFWGKRKTEIKSELNCAVTTINRWLARWEENEALRQSWFALYESQSIDKKAYSELLLSLFSDSPRTGTPCKFKDAIVEKIVALASSDPTSLGLPFTRWSEKLLQIELVNRKIVKSISTSQIGRLLKKT